MESPNKSRPRNAVAASLATEFQPYHSPLFMVMNDPVLHRFISHLAAKKVEQESAGGGHVTIELSRRLIEQTKERFRQHILEGELHLHVLAQLLSSHFLGGDFELHSNVIGTLPGGENRPFLIRERITRTMLFSTTDVDLGNQMLAKFRYHGADGWHPLSLSANFVEYLPSGRSTPQGVNRLTSRVKAEEELWNKVADELFSVDELVRRDKHLQQFSKYIKDVFGLKIVCEDEEACVRVYEGLQTLTPGECDWSLLDPAVGGRITAGPGDGSRPLLEFIETKDYLTCDPSRLKKTGWKALKCVVRWQEHLLEIQIQPVDNYYLELDHMSGPSHHSFRYLRDIFRREVGQRLPLYAFYRDLLRSLFLGTDLTPGTAGASIVITD